MSKMFLVYGIGQALLPVLPPPIGFQNPPTSNQANYEIGQIAYSPKKFPTSYYIYGGGGSWVNFATGSGSITSVLGTTNQITVTTSSGVATISLPAAITTPGSLTTTTSLATTNGNVTLGTAGNKIIIATGANASVGTSGAMSAGAVTVATTACSTTAKVFYARATLGGTAGEVSIAAQSGTGFSLISSSGSETSTFNWWIINA